MLLRIVIIQWMLVLMVGSSWGCLFGNDDGCTFPCKCRTDNPCEVINGQCMSGCQQGYPRPNGQESLYDWTGPGCQIGNVAYMKSASQSGVFGTLTADRAVDGMLGTSASQSRCAHPYNDADTPAWWMVDLEAPHVISNITIYNTHDSTGGGRLMNFTIGVGNTATTDDHSVCSNYGEPAVAAGSHVTLTCSSSMIGRYISFKRVGGKEIDRVTICEFVVMGYKPVEVDCNSCSTILCNNVVGCLPCSAGYKPTRYCNETCSPGTYGVNCASTCVEHHCNDSAACDTITGVCPGGACELWYIGESCDNNIRGRLLENYRNTTAVALDSTRVLVFWASEDGITADLAPYYGYFVEYRVVGTDNDKQRSDDVVHVFEQPFHSIIITGLNPDTIYEFTVLLYREHQSVRDVSTGTSKTVTATTQRAGTNPATTTTTQTLSPSPTTTTSQPPTPTLASTTLESPTTQTTTTPSVSTTTPQATTKSAMTTLTTREFPTTQSGTTDSTPAPPQTSSPQTPTDLTATSSSSTPSTYTSSVPPSPPTSTPRVTSRKTPPPKEPEPEGLSTGVIAGIAAAGGVLLIAIVIVIVLLSRRKKKKEKPRKKQLEIGDIDVRFDDDRNKNGGIVNHGLTLDVEAPDSPVLPGEEEEDEEVTLIPVAQLSSYINRLHLTKDGFKNQFLKIPKEHALPGDEAQKAANYAKNRFINIKPYDENRVILEVEEEAHSDYINASHVPAFKNDQRRYIATQGPKPATIADFWRMVWQENVHVIVMVTGLTELGSKKCEQYWPSEVGKEDTHGKIAVTMVSDNSYAEYAHKVISLERNDDVRKVHHFHFLSWIDKNKPDDAFPLLDFRRRVRAMDKREQVPMLVHCSAGVGRTGTFIALDCLLDQAQQSAHVDVYECVQHLRRSRMNMVQTLNQYTFLHEALEEGVLCGVTAIPSSQFSAQYHALRDDSAASLTKLEQQFQLLSKLKTDIEEYVDDGDMEDGCYTRIRTGALVANADKNRFSSITPIDRFRPYISGQQNSYINAVQVNEYAYEKSLILTQMPLPNTRSDFWKLVVQLPCHVIVMLNHEDDQTAGAYWPAEEGQTVTYDDIEVELSSTLQQQNVVSRQFKLNIDNEKTMEVTQYELLSWQDQTTPDPSHLMKLMELVKAARPADTKLLVHCMDGAERSGLFATAKYVIDKMEVDQEVDVFLACRNVTTRRPETINSLEQYKFLHDLAEAHLNNYTEYANIGRVN